MPLYTPSSPALALQENPLYTPVPKADPELVPVEEEDTYDDDFAADGYEEVNGDETPNAAKKAKVRAVGAR